MFLDSKSPKRCYYDKMKGVLEFLCKVNTPDRINIYTSFTSDQKQKITQFFSTTIDMPSVLTPSIEVDWWREYNHNNIQRVSREMSAGWKRLPIRNRTCEYALFRNLHKQGQIKRGYFCGKLVADQMFNEHIRIEYKLPIPSTRLRIGAV